MMTAFICNDAYPCVLFRYSVGTIPVSFLNTFEKYLGSVKPTAKAILVSVSSVLRNISHAFYTYMANEVYLCHSGRCFHLII